MRIADHELQGAIAGNPHDIEHNFQVHAQMLAQDFDPAVALAQDVDLVQDPDTSPNTGRDCRSRYSQTWKWPQTQNEAWIEAKVDEVGQPQDAHGDRRVTGAAEDGVHQEEHQDDPRAAQHDPRVGRSHMQNRRACAHQRQKPGRERKAHGKDQRGNRYAQNDGLHGGLSRARLVLFSDPARYYGRCSHAQSHGHGKDHHQHTFSNPDRGGSVRAQMRDKENIDDAEERFHRHLQHHGHSQQHNRTVDGNGGEILAGAPNGLFNQGEPSRGPGRNGSCYR